MNAPGRPAVEPFGWHLALDLHGCDPEAIRDRDAIHRYAAETCARIGMKPYGDPITHHFGHATEKTAGYSLAQFIETSLISGHFSEARDSTHLDVFSCLPFNREAATAAAREAFGGTVARRRWLERL